MWHQKERPMKMYARDGFLKDAPDDCKHYISLVGEDCIDIQRAYAFGKIGCRTDITAIEQDAERCNKIKLWFAMNRAMFNTTPIVLNTPMFDATKLRPADLVYLDLCGNFVAPDVLWAKDILAPILLPNCYMAITVSTNRRGNLYVPGIMDLLSTLHKEYYLKLSQEILIKQKFGDERTLEFATTYTILIQQLMFKDFTYKLGANPYKEEQSTHPMLLFRLLEMHHHKEPQTDEEQEITQELLEYTTKHCFSEAETSSVVSVVPALPRKAPIMSRTISGQDVITAVMKATTAGQKAAATRLQNQYVTQREKDGKSPVMVRAGIKARVARLLNGN